MFEASVIDDSVIGSLMLFFAYAAPLPMIMFLVTIV